MQNHSDPQDAEFQLLLKSLSGDDTGALLQAISPFLRRGDLNTAEQCILAYLQEKPYKKQYCEAHLPATICNACYMPTINNDSDAWYAWEKTRGWHDELVKALRNHTLATVIRQQQVALKHFYLSTRGDSTSGQSDDKAK
ncbi:hypothetical protein R8124_000610 [Salmonella enterica]|uniref:Uncharacterized protein n=2 Tax=Salmonella enterica TaxID=28901 RepID=F2Q958_SALET|nr:hypothetical protein [Salmonella enterica]CAX68154.1 hypothetical protein CTnscr_044 [Salmonella enterica subsp. enterica] [Salmonella enterica subsp. enterica serovar Senftenberg]HAB1649532.1 hypothetical protein [Salmonella enterica subsp. enterica]EBY8685134.1 hypothetical protein [Salmonella enterica subsp. enterica serovar Agona]EHW1978112.1 hypothetical protein [Salmonella enterica subsp. enterica serovar Agona]EKG5011703.1 hypothetical protein [Salmonella enterica]